MCRIHSSYTRLVISPGPPYCVVRYSLLNPESYALCRSRWFYKRKFSDGILIGIGLIETVNGWNRENTTNKTQLKVRDR